MSRVVSNKFRRLVVSNLVGWPFRPIFRVSQFGLWLFWPKSESDNVCIIICVWMDRWTGVKFCERQAKMKKDPFRPRAETTHVKMPKAGPKQPVTVTV